MIQAVRKYHVMSPSINIVVVSIILYYYQSTSTVDLLYNVSLIYKLRQAERVMSPSINNIVASIILHYYMPR